MPKKTKRTVRTRHGIKEYTYLGCPITKSRTAWCFRLCVPDDEGRGQCGRVAPHSIMGRTQKAIEAHNEERRKARIDELESTYLAAPDLEGLDPGVRVSGGEAEIVLHLDERHEDEAVAPPLCFKAMHDSARLAAASLLRTGDPATLEFTVTLTGSPGSQVLVGRSLFVGMSDDRFLTESVLHDAGGRELGRGSGIFAAER